MVEGVGHFEPLRHYAECHLLLEPLKQGSGLTFDSVCSTDVLDVAYQNAIYAYAASAEGQNWEAVKEAMASDTATSASVLTEFGGTLPAKMQEGYTAFGEMVNDVNDAADLIETAKANPTASSIKSALSPIVNPDEITVCDWAVADIMDDPGGFANHYLSKGGQITVKMAPGAGVYADIAAQ